MHCAGTERRRGGERRQGGKIAAAKVIRLVGQEDDLRRRGRDRVERDLGIALGARTDHVLATRDAQQIVRYANPAAENLLGASAKSLVGQPFAQLFAPDPALEKALADALVTHWDYSAQTVSYPRAGREPLPLACTLTRAEAPGVSLLAELRSEIPATEAT